MCRVVESGSLAAPVMSCEIMCQVMSEQSNEALFTIITYSCTVSDLVTMLWSMFVFLFKCFPKQNVYQWQLNMIFDVGSGLVWAQRHWSIRHNGINGIIIELLSRHIQSPMSPTIQYHVQKYNSIQNFSKPNRMCKSFISILYHWHWLLSIIDKKCFLFLEFFQTFLRTHVFIDEYSNNISIDDLCSALSVSELVGANDNPKTGDWGVSSNSNENMICVLHNLESQQFYPQVVHFNSIYTRSVENHIENKSYFLLFWFDLRSVT